MLAQNSKTHIVTRFLKLCVSTGNHNRDSRASVSNREIGVYNIVRKKAWAAITSRVFPPPPFDYDSRDAAVMEPQVDF